VTKKLSYRRPSKLHTVPVLETLRCSLAVTQGHWKLYHSKAGQSNYDCIISRFDTIHERDSHPARHCMSSMTQGCIQKYGLGGHEGMGSRPLPSPRLPLLFPSLTFPFPSPPLPLEVGLLIQLGGLEECCKLPQRGLGWSPSRNCIWHILALKSDIWWRQF